ncbi:2-C-methyl-D-erythritol 2,4-cyclodiphosphate synthase [Candidatus Magnetomorum sp. HK-1]|nr:2-C-methyl-D-erythritol 2,4-cyclodiphosphate synthase [Candidatus Magnetomorum sp. HK-1]
MNNNKTFRIGFGYDVHQLVKNRKLILGGIDIPFHKGLLGHSDADVLCHAVCDALLGAAALGDIGMHFPDTDSKYKNISSLKLLEQCSKKIQSAHYCIGNIDCTIIAQAPRMAPHIQQMRINLHNNLQVDIDQINIKATTTEKLGFIGNEKGIAAHCVALLLGQ